MQVKVYAKLNLTLCVGAKQGEFHPVDSVATSINLCDVVEVKARCDKEAHVSGVDNVEQTHNAAYKAACAFIEGVSTCGVDIHIQKGIPFGSGLGGSSADAAAVLYCMCKLNKIDMGCEKIRHICSKLGSDVTFMLHGGLGRMCGKGDDVEYFSLQRPMYFALTTFNKEMSSREVYGAFDRIVNGNIGDGKAQQPFSDGRNDKLLTLLQQGNNEQALTYFSNQLQQATRSLSDYAEKYLHFTKANSFRAVMTGSGSAYYIAFATRDKAERAVNLLNSHGFATTLCQTVPHGIEVSTI